MVHFQVEDNIAQASCLLGDLQAARKHCKASIEVNLHRFNFFFLMFTLVDLTSSMKSHQNNLIVSVALKLVTHAY